MVNGSKIKSENRVAAEMTIAEIEEEFFTRSPIEPLFESIQALHVASPGDSDLHARTSYLMGVYYEPRDYEKATEYYRTSHAIALKLQNKRVLSDTLHCEAIRAYRSGNLNKVTRLEQQALALAIEADHPFRICFSYFMLATVASLFGVTEDHLSNLNLAFQLSIENGILKLQGRILSELAELYLISDNLAKAKQYAEQAIVSAAEISIEGKEYYEHNIRLATIELELKKYGEVIKLIKQVRKSLPIENHSLWCVTHTLMGKVHEAKRRYDDAAVEFCSALSLADYVNAERVRSNIHTHLAELYLKTRKPKLALKEALAALNDAEIAQDSFVRKEALRCVHDCYKALGKFREAYEYLEKYNALIKESDVGLLNSRLEYHALKRDYEKEKVMSKEKTRQSELLRISLEHKERELTEKTRHLIKQTEALAQFRDDLRALVRRSPAGDPYVAEIRERLNSFPESELNWKDFDRQFKEVHPEFLFNLEARFPKLTPMEKKICALLRLNLTSSDIARLLFLSERNIENHRYRIRGKLSLDTRESLHEFLGAI